MGISFFLAAANASAKEQYEWYKAHKDQGSSRSKSKSKTLAYKGYTSPKEKSSPSKKLPETPKLHSNTAPSVSNAKLEKDAVKEASAKAMVNDAIKGNAPNQKKDVKSKLKDLKELKDRSAQSAGATSSESSPGTRDAKKGDAPKAIEKAVKGTVVPLNSNLLIFSSRFLAVVQFFFFSNSTGLLFLTLGRQENLFCSNCVRF